MLFVLLVLFVAAAVADGHNAWNAPDSLSLSLSLSLTCEVGRRRAPLVRAPKFSGTEPQGVARFVIWLALCAGLMSEASFVIVCASHQTHAAIAQLGEGQTEDLKVPGSIPGLGTNIYVCV